MRRGIRESETIPETFIKRTYLTAQSSVLAYFPAYTAANVLDVGFHGFWTPPVDVYKTVHYYQVGPVWF